MDLSQFKDDLDDLDAGDRAAAQLLTFFAASKATAASRENKDRSDQKQIFGAYATSDPEKCGKEENKKKVKDRRIKKLKAQKISIKTESRTPEITEGADMDETEEQQDVKDYYEPDEDDESEMPSKRKEKKKRGPNKKIKNGSSSPEDEDNPKPKRPMSAYNYFFQSERAKLSGNVEETSKVIGQRWKDLKTDKRRCYVELAEKDSKRYREELREYQFRGAAGPKKISIDVYGDAEDLTSDHAANAEPSVLVQGKLNEAKPTKRSLEDTSFFDVPPSKKPKKPVSAFNMFYKEEKRNFRGTKEEITDKIGQKWMEMDPQIRKKYETFATQESERYKVASAEYEKFKACEKIESKQEVKYDVSNKNLSKPVADKKETMKQVVKKIGVSKNEASKKTLPKRVVHSEESSKKVLSKRIPLSEEISKKESPKKDLPKKDLPKKELKGDSKPIPLPSSAALTEKKPSRNEKRVSETVKQERGDLDSSTQEKKFIEPPNQGKELLDNIKQQIKKEKRIKDDSEKHKKKVSPGKMIGSKSVKDAKSQSKIPVTAKAPTATNPVNVPNTSTFEEVGNMHQRQHSSQATSMRQVMNENVAKAAPLQPSASKITQSSQAEANSLARLVANAATGMAGPSAQHNNDFQNMLQLKALLNLQGSLGNVVAAPAVPHSSSLSLESVLRGGFPLGGYQQQNLNLHPNYMEQSLQQMLGLNAFPGMQSAMSHNQPMDDQSIQSLLPLLLAQTGQAMNQPT